MPARRHLRPCLACGEPAFGPRCPDHGIDVHAARTSPDYLAARDHLLATFQPGQPCPLCTEPILTIGSASADHLEPLILGGAAAGPLELVHRSCNSRQGAELRDPYRAHEISNEDSPLPDPAASSCVRVGFGPRLRLQPGKRGDPRDRDVQGRDRPWREVPA